MTAGNGETAGDGDYEGCGEHGEYGEYGGPDALMAAITGEPLPEEARRDPAFLAEHRAAQADLAVLREGLGRLAEELDPPAPASPVRPVRAARAAGRARRRPLRAALTTLAVAASLSLVAGIGWLGAHPGGGVSADQAGDKGGDGAGDASGDGAGHGGKAVRPGARTGQELACAGVVVEGTVAGVVPQGSGSRVTVTVERSYKPARGPAEVGFLLDGAANPAPRPGQHVLVEVGRGSREASRWTVGDAAVAADRARIEAALPGSRHLTCP
ncbi:hypothetical protein [Streptomyces sp. NPDC048106]|uniref:hypothetical protein n=1 Tax=Streptomyces sp. NPDC048106 TaxID=3155750 RepID=UPI0034534579